MKKDPRVRQDGRCALKRCTKPCPEIAVKEQDPFCTAECCRAHHGIIWKMDAEKAEA